MNTTLTFESAAGLLGETKTESHVAGGPAFCPADRVARAFFLGGTASTASAERALGSGVRFDPRTFRTEFYRAGH